MQTFLRLLYLSGILIFISLNAIAQAPGIGLVAYYPFNGNAIDESGNGHWGYVSGPSLTTDRFGSSSRAFSFDGINDLIEIQDQSDLNTLDFTYSMWINISEYGTSSINPPLIASISMAKYGNTQGFIIYNNPQGQYVIRTHPPNIPETSNDYFTALPIPVNTWKHVVFTKVGQKMCVYVDGSLSSTGSYLGNYTTSPGNLLIGCGPWRLDEFFKGKLDDIRIYNRGLSETEVAQLYNSESPTTKVATCVSIKSGLWSDPSVWSCNQIPAITDIVQISTGHTITISANTIAKAFKLIENGKLIFEGPNSVLTLGKLQAPSAGLVAYYPFNGNAIDESGNGHWGYVSGPSLTTDRFGSSSRAFSFDGINDLIEIQDQSDLNTLDFTYSMWINISEYGTSSLDGPRIASISMAKYGNTQGFIIYNNPQGQYVIRTHPPNIPETSNDYFTALPIPINTWKHVVFTKVGQKMCVYVDGSLSSTGSYLGNYTTSPGNLLIGCGPWRLDEFFKGKLDDIRIYNRGLSETEVAQLYDSEKLP